MMLLTRMRVNEHRDESGASAVEYGLLAVAVAALIVVVVFLMGGMVQHIFGQTCSDIGSSVSGSPSCSA
jgi:pilus assembly protein Flp/PilA